MSGVTVVVVLDDYQDVARRFGPWEVLGGRVELRVHQENHTGEALLDRLRDADVVVAMRERTRFPRSLLEKLPRLSLIAMTGFRTAAIDMDAARDLGVTVCGTASPQHAIPELTWALILAATRRVCVEDRAVRAGRWQTGVGMELTGRTLGVIGLGRMGGRVAEIGRAFGMEVLAWSQNLDPRYARARGVTPVRKDELFARSDVVTVHVQLSERTHGLVGAAELARMSSDAYIVNTSRGAIIDETALVAALRSGAIAGAGLDVFDVEPLPPDHPLRSAPNTVLTPHIGFVSRGTFTAFYRDVVDNIRCFLDGSPVRVLPAWTPDD